MGPGPGCQTVGKGSPGGRPLDGGDGCVWGREGVKGWGSFIVDGEWLDQGVSKRV